MAAQDQALIIRDSEGNYYVIPPAVLAASRVPADALPEREEEVAGYIAYVNNPAYIANPNNTPAMVYYGPYQPWLPLPYPPVSPTPGHLQPPSHFDPGLLQ